MRYQRTIHAYREIFLKRSKEGMSAISGDGTNGVDRATAAARVTRSIAIAGNRIDSRELFVTDREIMIAHGEDTYRLRLTSQNKLILTK